jgi:hypothetical protein
MQTTHTPGPWRIVGGTEVRGTDGTIVCNTADYRVPRTALESVALPDAALIAAAPDLLAACQAVLDEFPAFDNQRIESIKAICRAAIARATGI